MSNHLTPLDVCLAVFGGRSEVEAIAGSRPKGSYAWAKPSITRKAGDLPSHVQRKMLIAARRRKLPFEAEWLILGARRTDLDPVLEQIRCADPASQVAAQ